MDTVAINHQLCQGVIEQQIKHIRDLKDKLAEMTAERDKLQKQLEDYYRSVEFMEKVFN